MKKVVVLIKNMLCALKWYQKSAEQEYKEAEQQLKHLNDKWAYLEDKEKSKCLYFMLASFSLMYILEIHQLEKDVMEHTLKIKAL
jgi:TPR repeat protein